jgi:hypothetical protein
VVDRLKEGLAANSQRQAVVFSRCLKSGEDPVADDNAGKRPVPLVSRADTERLDLGPPTLRPGSQRPLPPVMKHFPSRADQLSSGSQYPKLLIWSF